MRLLIGYGLGAEGGIKYYRKFNSDHIKRKNKVREGTDIVQGM